MGENKLVHQLQDDLQEKDQMGEQLKKHRDDLRVERDHLKAQTVEQQDMIFDVQNQVRYLNTELERNRSTIVELKKNKSKANGSDQGLGLDLQQILDGDEPESDSDEESDSDSDKMKKKKTVKQWLPKNKVRSDRTRSKTLVFQVRQLIGHFNVLVTQMKSTEQSYQNDLKLDIVRRDKEIKQLKEQNKQVHALQDDLQEKDEMI